MSDENLNPKDEALIQKVVRLVTQPGEILVVTFPEGTKFNQIVSFRNGFQKLAKDANFQAKVMIMIGDVEFKVLTEKPE